MIESYSGNDHYRTMKREYTKFGEELKILRTRRHQSIQDMADVLEASKGFLSRVESGKKAIPGDWIDLITDHYHLKPYDRQILEDAASLSKTRIQIILREVPNYKRILAIKFEKYFDQIDEDTSEKIISIIEELFVGLRTF